MSPSRSPMPEVPLRRRLFLLAAVAIVPLAAMSGLGLLAMVQQHREQVVGSISRGPRGEFGVPVRVPVVRGGELRYVLTGVIRPEIILEVLKRQRVPDDWVVSVFDANGLRVARSRAHDTYLATPASPSLQQLLGRGVAEGSGVTRALEGDEVYSAFTRLADSGWTVAIGVPVSVVQAGAMRSMAALGGGLLLSLAIGTVAALWVARSINRPIAKLRGAAQALGRGETPVPIESDIHEIQEVADALAAAAELRARGEAEREDLLTAERMARAAAEHAVADAQAARAQAETANRVKDEFLAMLGHELRNPLAPIVTALHLMARRGDAASVKERSIIERQVAHLRRLVDDLLDVS